MIVPRQAGFRAGPFASGLLPVGIPMIGAGDRVMLAPSLRIPMLAGRAGRRAPFLGARGLGTFAVFRGLGAVRDYCRSNPPDQTTIDILAARGDTVELIDCISGAPPSPQPPQPFVTPVDTVGPGPAPVYQPPTGMEDCVALGLQSTAGQQCVARNTARAAAAEDAFLQANRDFQTRLCISNNGGGYVPAGQDVAAWCANQYSGSVVPPLTRPLPPVPVGATGPMTPMLRNLSLNWKTSGDPKLLKVGDTWQVTIQTDGGPGLPVVVVGGKDGGSATTQMGTTDSSGGFVQTGTVTADQVGSWSETWKVAGITAGTFSFSVVPASAPVINTSTSGGAAGGGTTQQTTAGAFDIAGLLTGSAFGGVPNWVWLAAGVGAIAFMGKH